MSAPLRSYNACASSVWEARKAFSSGSVPKMRDSVRAEIVSCLEQAAGRLWDFGSLSRDQIERIEAIRNEGRGV